MSTLPKGELKLIKVKDLKAAEYNPRKITEQDFDSLKKSIQEFGFVEPVVVNKDLTLIGGHQRVKAAQALGIEEIPVMVVDLTKEQEKALNIALNRISGEWAMDKLAELVASIATTDVVNASGLSNKEISNLLDLQRQAGEEVFDKEKSINAALEKPEDAEELHRGEIWQCGPHRIMCGSSTSLDDLSMLMDGVEADMVFTDPPYNVAYKSSNPDLGSIKNDNMGEAEFQRFMNDVMVGMHHVTKDGAVFYICSGWQSFAPMEKAIETVGMHISDAIIWVKNRGIATMDYINKHEQVIKAQKGKKAKAIFYGWKKGNHYAQDDQFMDYDVWEEPNKSSNQYLHPTEKPDWLVMRAIKNSSRVKEVVLDMFAGSGSCLIAAEKCGRTFYGMELDYRFIQVILDRYYDYSKIMPVRLNDSMSWEEVKAAGHPPVEYNDESEINNQPETAQDPSK